MQTTKTLLTACGILLAFGSQAWAQTLPTKEKGYFNVNVAFQAASQTVDQAATFSLYEETGSFKASRKVSGGVLWDVSGGIRIWRNLAIGAGFSAFSDKGTAPVTADVPHPLFLGRPRSVSFTSGDLKHAEKAIHLQGVWFVEIMPGFDLALSFGPSIFMVREDAITGVAVTEAGSPFTLVNARIAGTETLKKTKVGFNLGADLTYMFTPYLGVGGMLRYTRASVTVQPSVGNALNLHAGGPQIGAGVRVRF